MNSVLDQLEALLSAATKGPWRRRGSGSPHVDLVADEAGDASPLVTLHEAGAIGDRAHRRAETVANAELIAATKSHLPALLACARALEPFARRGRLLGAAVDGSQVAAFPVPVSDYRAADKALKMLESNAT